MLGLSTIGTDYSVGARSGTIATLDGVVKRVLGSVVGKTTTVDVTATGRKVWSLANVKAWVDETAPRQLSVEITADNGQIAQRLSAQGLEVGELMVKAHAGAATVTCGPVCWTGCEVSCSLSRTSCRDSSLSEAAAETPGASLVYNELDGGRVLLRVDDSVSSRWVAIEEGLPEPGGELVLRLGAPGAEPGTEPVWFNARMSRAQSCRPARTEPPGWPWRPVARAERSQSNLPSLQGQLPESYPLATSTRTGRDRFI